MSAPWIVGPAWDTAFLLSGLWLAPLVLVVGDPRPLYLVLTLALWTGHRLSSAYVAYCTPQFRALLRTQRARFVVAPLATAAVVLAILLPDDATSPWSRADRVLALVGVDYILNAYHFAAQHFGVLSLYRLRAALHEPRARRMDRAFALGIGGVIVVIAELVNGTAALAPGSIDDTLALVIRAAGTVIVVVATALMLLRGRASLQRGLALTAIAVPALMAFWLGPEVFLFVWTVQHWTSAIGLASVVASGSVRSTSSRWYRWWHLVHGRRAGLILFLAVVSVVLFPFMEVEAAGDASGNALNALDALVHRLASSSWTPVLLALAFASAFVHYQLDRAVFRFSDPAVRSAADALVRAPRSPTTLRS